MTPTPRRENIKATHNDADAWMKAEYNDIEKFKKIGVRCATFQNNVSVTPIRWVYPHKEDDLKGATNEARCVLKGCCQKEGICFNKYRVLSRLAELLSIRVFTLLATKYGHPIHHLDIELAFLNTPLPRGEEIYVSPPPGHDNQPGSCWFPRKSVNGMKQSGSEWYKSLAAQLT